MIRACAPKVLEAKKEYSCTGCGGHFLLETDESQFYQHPVDSNCPEKAGLSTDILFQFAFLFFELQQAKKFVAWPTDSLPNVIF